LTDSFAKGSALANLLLEQGCSFPSGGLKFHDQQYNPNSIRLYSSMMFMSVASLAIPSAFARISLVPSAENAERVAAGFSLNIALSLLLLLLYVMLGVTMYVVPN
jgi:Ca2+:H+ antiporter